MKLLRCPKCNHMGEAYDMQIAGKQSLVCSRCGYHYYSNRTPFKIKTLPVVNINRYLVRRRIRYWLD